jgi:hypothetical protein
MPPSIPGAVLALALAALAACSSSPPSMPTTLSGGGPQTPPVPIDGNYDGIMTLSRGDAMTCGNQDTINLQVTNHTFSYRLSQPRAEWKPFINFTATIGADGSFYTQQGPDSLSGSVTAGHMAGDIAGDMCGFSFVADRGGTL